MQHNLAICVLSLSVISQLIVGCPGQNYDDLRGAGGGIFRKAGGRGGGEMGGSPIVGIAIDGGYGIGSLPGYGNRMAVAGGVPAHHVYVHGLGQGAPFDAGIVLGFGNNDQMSSTSGYGNAPTYNWESFIMPRRSYQDGISQGLGYGNELRLGPVNDNGIAPGSGYGSFIAPGLGYQDRTAPGLGCGNGLARGIGCVGDMGMGGAPVMPINAEYGLGPTVGGIGTSSPGYSLGIPSYAPVYSPMMAGPAVTSNQLQPLINTHENENTNTNININNNMAKHRPGHLARGLLGIPQV